MSWRGHVLPGTAILVAALICSVPVSGSPAAESRFAQLDGAKVHYTDYGAGENALVFVHGWRCDETFWTAQASAFGGKFHFITIVLPGTTVRAINRGSDTMDLDARAIGEA